MEFTQVQRHDADGCAVHARVASGAHDDAFWGRDAWPGPDRLCDSAGYAILHQDWASGTVTAVDRSG